MALVEASWITNLYTALSSTLPGKGFSMTGVSSVTNEKKESIDDTDINTFINMLNAQRDNEFFKQLKNSQWPATTVDDKSKILTTTKTDIDKKINEMLAMNANYAQTRVDSTTGFNHNSITTFATTTGFNHDSVVTNATTTGFKHDSQALNSTCSDNGVNFTGTTNATTTGHGRSSNSTQSGDGDCTDSSDGYDNGYNSRDSITVNTCANTPCPDDDLVATFTNAHDSFDNGYRSNDSTKTGNGKSTDSTESCATCSNCDKDTCAESGDATNTNFSKASFANQTCATNTNFSKDSCADQSCATNTNFAIATFQNQTTVTNSNFTKTAAPFSN